MPLSLAARSAKKHTDGQTEGRIGLALTQPARVTTKASSPLASHRDKNLRIILATTATQGSECTATRASEGSVPCKDDRAQEARANYKRAHDTQFNLKIYRRMYLIIFIKTYQSSNICGRGIETTATTLHAHINTRKIQVLQQGYC